MKFIARFTDHGLSRCLLEEFAYGAPNVEVAGLNNRAGVLMVADGHIPVYYGILRGCGEAMKEDMKAGRPFVYIDHGYFGDHDNETLTGHYRMVVGGLHHRIPENPVPLSAIKIDLEPERVFHNEPPMVLIPPSEAVADFYGIDAVEWVRRFSDLFGNFVVSTKAMGNLSALMDNCRGIITHSSTAAVRALVMGIPAWCTAERAPVPNHGIYDRDHLLGWLAERQFTLKEIHNGDHLPHLNREVKEFLAARRGMGSDTLAGRDMCEQPRQGLPPLQ